MSEIDDLIADLCPKGVEFMELGELLDYEQPGKYIVTSTNYSNEHSMPVLTAGQSFILGYTDETQGIYDANPGKPVIIFDDFTTSFHWVDFSFKVKSSAMKMLRPKPGASIDFRFAYFAMRCTNYSPTDHSRHWISQYSKFTIPVPPIEVQRAIVGALDSYTELEAGLEVELEAELKAREKQYEYYRNQFLTFSEESARLLSLEEVCQKISAGGDLPKNYAKGQTLPSDVFPYPIYSNGTDGSALYGYTDGYKIDDEAVTISARGTIGYHTIRSSKFTPIVRLITLIPKKDVVTIKFLNYALDKTVIGHSGGSIPQLTVPDVKKLEVQIPSLDEQNQIGRAHV